MNALRFAGPLCCGALFSLGACGGWHAQGLTPAAVIQRESSAQIRLTLVDSSWIELRHPSVTGDTIRGLVEQDTVALPLDRVAYASLHRGSATGPVLMFGLGVPVLLGVLVALTWNQ